MSFPIQTILSVSESHRVNPFQSLRTITAGQELNANNQFCYSIRTLPQRLSLLICKIYKVKIILNYKFCKLVMTTISIVDYTIIYRILQVVKPDAPLFHYFYVFLYSPFDQYKHFRKVKLKSISPIEVL